MNSDIADEQATPVHRWQFSLRRMLLLTTIVAAILTLIVNWRNLPFIALFLPLIWLCMRVNWSSELVTRGRWPRLALITWSFVGICFGALAVVDWIVMSDNGSESIEAPGGVIMLLFVSCGVLCFFKAWNTLGRR